MKKKKNTGIANVVIDLSSREQLNLKSKNFTLEDIEEFTNAITDESDIIKQQYYSTNISISRAKQRTFSQLLKKFLINAVL